MAHQASWLDIYPSQILLDDSATNLVAAQEAVRQNGGTANDDEEEEEKEEENGVQGPREGEQRPVLVDVGGNVGHDMQRFYNAHSEVAERCYLQDRPEVVSLSRVPDPVKKMGYDFFTPQPVRGQSHTQTPCFPPLHPTFSFPSLSSVIQASSS